MIFERKNCSVALEVGRRAKAIFRFEKTAMAVPRENELVYDHYTDAHSPPACSVLSGSGKRTREPPACAAYPWDEIKPDVAGNLRSEPLRKWALRQGMAWMSPLEQLASGYVPEEVALGPDDRLVQVMVAAWWLWR